MPESHQPSDLNSHDPTQSNSSETWMRYMLANLNRSVEQLAHELRITKDVIETIVREERKELNARLDEQERRINALEQSIAVLTDRMLRITVIGTLLGGTFLSYFIPKFLEVVSDDQSFVPDRITIDRPIASASDRTTTDPAGSENG